MHEAFFFGPDERQIFSIYHPSLGGDGRVLTVLCPPLFAELNRTHAALRKLAIALSERGHHVLRMDYRGSGDSFGDLKDMTLADWVQDIELTVQEGRELTGCRAVRLLGVRGSALLASRAAGSMPDIERLVFWDPISDGIECLSSLQREQAAVLDTHHYLSRDDRRDAKRQYGVYEVSNNMLEEFRTIDASVYSAIPSNKVRVVSTSTDSVFPVAEAPASVVNFACDWETQIEGVIFSQPVLESIMENLTAS
jgi:pimeloyl-ACP methyl ester carboxylesterase